MIVGLGRTAGLYRQEYQDNKYTVKNVSVKNKFFKFSDSSYFSIKPMIEKYLIFRIKLLY